MAKSDNTFNSPEFNSIPKTINLVPITEPKIKDSLVKESEKIQPDVVRERNLEGVDEKGAKLYDEMTKIYNDWCQKDISFVLFFATPTEQKIISFHRICEIDEQNKYQKLCHNFMMSMIYFLNWCGMLSILEKFGLLVYNKKFFPKSFKEEHIDKK